MHRGNKTVLGDRVRKFPYTVDTDKSTGMVFGAGGTKLPDESPLISRVSIT